MNAVMVAMTTFSKHHLEMAFVAVPNTTSMCIERHGNQLLTIEPKNPKSYNLLKANLN
jgi:hypothetical protein